MGLAFLIMGEKLQLLSERKVLKEYEYAALLEAEDLVQVARTEAQDIVVQAHSKADDMRQKGYEEGWAAAEEEHASQLISSALQAQNQLISLRETMAQLVVKGVEQIASELPPEQLLASALERVEDMLRHEPMITLHVSPEQEDEAQQALSELATRFNWASLAQVQVDHDLAVGQCVVQTASGSLEVGLQAQISAIERAVRSLVSVQ